MKSFSPTIFLLLLILFSITLLVSAKHGPHQQKAASNDLIPKLCDVAVNEKLCVLTLRSHPDSAKADGPGLAAIAIRLAIDNGTDIYNQIKNFESTVKDEKEKKHFNDCHEDYNSALEQLEDALRALKSKGYEDATTWIQSAMASSENCEDGFTEKPGQKGILTNKNSHFQQLCGNALAIVNMLEATGK